MDNVSRYTEGQDGLFHVKLSHTRMLVNEYWGKPNAKSPWTLWKVNALLGRKAISAGWKSKSAPPFRPSYELMLTFALPANILDAFRIYCPKDDLQEWVDLCLGLAGTSCFPGSARALNYLLSLVHVSGSGQSHFFEFSKKLSQGIRRQPLVRAKSERARTSRM